MSASAVLKGNTSVVFSMSGIVASLETGFAPQSLNSNWDAKSKEFIDQKGNVITDALHSYNGTLTLPLLFLGGTVPAIGDFCTIATIPTASADWYVVGYGDRLEAEGGLMTEIKLKRHAAIVKP